MVTQPAVVALTDKECRIKKAAFCHRGTSHRRGGRQAGAVEYIYPRVRRPRFLRGNRTTFEGACIRVCGAYGAHGQAMPHCRAHPYICVSQRQCRHATALSTYMVFLKRSRELRIPGTVYPLTLPQKHCSRAPQPATTPEVCGGGVYVCRRFSH